MRTQAASYGLQSHPGATGDRATAAANGPTYSRAASQIGAAARDVLRDAKKVLERMFGLQHVVSTAEGESVDVPAAYDAGRYRLTGNVSRTPPVRGEVTHAGWQATKCDLPAWTGKPAAALVIAPAEVQVR